MKIKNIFYAALLLVTTLSIQSCNDDLGNKESYTGRSSGPATKLNVTRDSVTIDALSFNIGASSTIIGVECDGDWTAELSDTSWVNISNHAGYGFTDRWSFMRLDVVKNTGDERSATLTMKSGDITKLIALTQKGTGTDAGDTFPSAFTTLEDFVLGYNLGNTLDSNPVGDWWDPTTKTPIDWEKGWGQPETTPEIINAIASKGFNMIRIPVTWKPHMDADGNVDAAWMARVTEVVDMVLDAGCYCILNVQHDTGGDSSAWLKADMASYPESSVLFKKLWTQIANNFRSYGDHLLFEAFNEILNASFSWTPPSAGSSDYEAIRRLHQDFVDAVRATGGNNEFRNLVINPYAATNTQTPLDEMAVPDDIHANHIMMSVHSYDPYNFCNDNGEWTVYVFNDEGKQEIDGVFSRVMKRGSDLGLPTFFGEFGAIAENRDVSERIKYAQYMAKNFKANGTAGLWWMGLFDRNTLNWYDQEIVDAMFKELQ